MTAMERGKLSTLTLVLMLISAVTAGVAAARDFAAYPIGAPQVVGGLEVGCVYFQPIDLEGGLMRPAAQSDLHLEVDIHATKDDPDGYAEGDWRPYLAVGYRLTRIATGQMAAGTLAPLVAYGSASIGKPHYGDNLKMMGPGRYHLEVTVAPPGGQAGIGGFAPFTVSSDFVYAGVGKKGAY